MIITKENYFEFLEIVSNENYGDCIYTTVLKENGYEVFIKSCCANCIGDLQEAGYIMDMSSKGLHVWKW